MLGFPGRLRPTLNQIGAKHGTDKVTSSHTWFSSTYMDRYAHYFEQFRDLPIRFLEIGILNGASLRTWREQFPNAEIHGIDVRPECKVHEDRAKNIFVHIVDCSVDEPLEEFVKQFPGYFDVILDDGSHINEITLRTFRHLQNALRPVGYYIVEDLGCAYIREDLPNHVPYWPGISVTKNVPRANDPETMLDLYRDIHRQIDLPSNRNLQQFEFLHHYPQIVVMRKNEMYLTAPSMQSAGQRCESHTQVPQKTEPSADVPAVSDGIPNSEIS